MIRTLLFSTLLATGISTGAYAAVEAIGAAAKIVTPLKITEVDGLYFGTVDRGDNNTKTLLANFDITGEPETSISISVDPFASLQRLFTDDPNRVSVDLQLVSEPGALSAEGAGKIYISGQLSLSNELEDGYYQGSYNITANY